MKFLKNISKEEWIIGGAVALLVYVLFSKKGGKSGKTKAMGIQNANKYQKYGTDVVSVAKEFETLATGGYKWKDKSGKPSTGMPIDIYFKGADPIFKKPEDGSTYCTGYTFSVAFTVALNRGLLNDFTDKDIAKMQEVWNAGDPKSYPKLCVDAISKPLASNLKALGKEVTIEQAKAGDFCQIWRSTTSGHSVIVLEMIKKDNKIVGIKYYSSNSTKNPTTNRSGAGENTEYFSDSGGTMLRKNTYYARLNQ
jgi:hypothetical protein